MARHHICPCCHRPVQVALNAWQDHVRTTHEGALLFATASQCHCGFCVPFYAVMNYLVHPQTDPSYGLDFQLPVIYPASLEATRFEIQCLIHIGKYELALRFIEFARENQLADGEYFFLRAYCHHKLGDVETAKQEYEHSLEDNNQQAHVWYNLWCLAKQQGQWQDTAFYQAKYTMLGLTQDNTQPLHLREPSITNIASALSSQGQINVQDAEEQRSLFINQEAQGGVWLQHGQPSAIPANPDGAAMLLNGIHFNADQEPTHGLILGLGAAAGVVALLENFSQLSLTVVEADPAIIHLCLRCFPKAEALLKAGRLRVECQDAYDYVSDMTAPVDFIVADVYQGNFEPSPRLFDPNFFACVKDLCQLLSVNLKHPESHFDRNSLIEYFSWPGIALKHVYELSSSFIAGYEIYHTALFNRPIAHLENFVPFRHDDNPIVRSFRRDFRQRFQQAENPKSKFRNQGASFTKALI